MPALDTARHEVGHVAEPPWTIRRSSHPLVDRRSPISTLVHPRSPPTVLGQGLHLDPAEIIGPRHESAPAPLPAAHDPVRAQLAHLPAKWLVGEVRKEAES